MKLGSVAGPVIKANWRLTFGHTPFHYGVSTLFPLWSVFYLKVPFLECAIFGICCFWNVLFLEFGLFGIWSLSWTLKFVLDLHPFIMLSLHFFLFVENHGCNPFHYAVSTLIPPWSVSFFEYVLFGMCSFWNLVFVMNPKIWSLLWILKFVLDLHPFIMLSLHYSLFVMNPKVCLGHTPFHYAVSTLFPFWSVSFLEYALFGMCPFWNLVFVVMPKICLGLMYTLSLCCLYIIPSLSWSCSCL